MINSAQQNINGWMTHLKQESKFNISVDCAIFGYNFNELQVLMMECDLLVLSYIPIIIVIPIIPIQPF